MNTSYTYSDWGEELGVGLSRRVYVEAKTMHLLSILLVKRRTGRGRGEDGKIAGVKMFF